MDLAAYLVSGLESVYVGADEGAVCMFCGLGSEVSAGFWFGALGEGAAELGA